MYMKIDKLSNYSIYKKLFVLNLFNNFGLFSWLQQENTGDMGINSSF